MPGDVTGRYPDPAAASPAANHSRATDDRAVGHAQLLASQRTHQEEATQQRPNQHDAWRFQTARADRGLVRRPQANRGHGSDEGEQQEQAETHAGVVAAAQLNVQGRGRHQVNQTQQHIFSTEQVSAGHEPYSPSFAASGASDG